MSDAIRLALIGIGHIAEYQLQALSRSPGWKLVGAADVHAERQTLLPRDVPFHHSAADLIATCDADLFLVATPNTLHYPVARLVIAAGKGLLLEKPCCESDEQLDDLIQTAASQGVHFSVLLHAAHARDVEWFIDKEPDLMLGPLGAFSCTFSDPYVIAGRRVQAAESLGGAWFDSGINALSVIGRFIQPSCLAVSAFESVTSGDSDRYVSRARARLRFDSSGRVGSGEIETNWELGLNRKTTTLRYRESGNEVLLDHSNECVTITRDGVAIESVSLANGLPRLVNHYVNVFRDARLRYLRGESNLETAVPLHRLLFSATTAQSG